MPVTVLGWLAGRLAHLLPPRPFGVGGTRPLALAVRLDAVAAVLLDGLSYRRAGRMVGISKTEVGDSLDLLLRPLAALGFCQPDGTFVTSLGELGERLAEIAEVGEAVVVDGLATPPSRTSWASRFRPGAWPSVPSRRCGSATSWRWSGWPRRRRASTRCSS